jgi:hypothetical protein
MKLTKTRLKEMIREELLNEGFEPTLTLTSNDSEIGKFIFKHKDDALKFIKMISREYGLKRQQGFWGNSKTGVELSINF